METFSAMGSAFVHVGFTWAIHLLEAMGFFIILSSALRAFIAYWVNRGNAPLRSCRLRLAEGLATGLEFKLGGEILRTVIVRDWEEILVLGAIVILRVVMAFMIYWEIKQEQTMHPQEIYDAMGRE